MFVIQQVEEGLHPICSLGVGGGRLGSDMIVKGGIR